MIEHRAFSLFRRFHSGGKARRWKDPASKPAGRAFPPCWSRVLAAAPALSALMAAGSLLAQEPHKRKVPGLEKIIASGPTRGAFSGQVSSLDLKRHVLNVNAAKGESVEIFPVKKGVKVTTADGEKSTLESLLPGTNVIVYYEQKGDRRTVSQIVVLAPGPEEKKKKAPPPS